MNDESKPIEIKPFYFLPIFIAILLALTIYFFTRPQPICGNGICEPNENCGICRQDCSCPSGYECKEYECVPLTTVTPSLCGNQKCELDENCWDCPEDCKCAKNEYCSENEKKCVKPVCGNGICEVVENSYTCCIDCPCIVSGEVCNDKTFKCEFPINLTDEKAIDLAIAYFKEKGEEVLSAEVIYTSMTPENELAKFVQVYLKNQELPKVVSVTENGIVKEEKVY